MPPVRKAKPSNQAVQPIASESKPTRTVISGQLDKKIKKQTERKERKEAQQRGVVFIKHLPHGFFEEQLKNYFQQFGTVTRLRLSRSRRTGGSKGFAFVEFEFPEVAQVAAETMDNYLMFKKVVKAAYIPPEQQCFNYFKTNVRKVKNKAGQEIYVSHKTAAINRKMKAHNDWSQDNYQKRTARSLQKLKKLNKKYAHLGIDFSKLAVFPNKASKDDKPAEAAETAAKAEEVTATSSKNKKISAATKRKSNVEEENIKPAKASKKTTKKAVPELADLLGNTLNEDSEDEEYIATPESDDDNEEDDDIEDSDEDQSSENDSDSNDDTEEDNDDDDADDTSSDEETYGFSKDSDDNEADIKKSKTTNKKVPKQTFSKSLKAQKVDRLEQRIKRKPHTGAIQKAKKPMKAAKLAGVAKTAKTAQATKNQMKLIAAKEMAKTLKAKPKVPSITKLGKKSKLRK